MRFRDIHRVMRSPGAEGGGSAVADPPAGETKPEEKAGEKKAEEKPAGETKPDEKAGDEKKPEEKKPERKTLLDGEEKKEEAKVVVPDKYELKLPAKSVLPQPVLERTAATARELGLSNEAAQKMLDFVHQEATSSLNAVLEAARPGGAAWEKQLDDFEAKVKADAEIGGAKLKESVLLAKRVVDTFFSKEIKEFLHETGLGSHPELLRGLVKIGRGMAEDKFIVGHGDGAGGGSQSIEDRWYGKSTSKKE